MTRSALLALAAALAVTLLATPAEAQWKWKDKSGRVQYSDLPPPQGTPDTDILTRPSGGSGRQAAPASPAALAAAGLSASGAAAASSSPTAAPASRGADPELEAKRKIAEQEQQKKIKDLEAKMAVAKADNCVRAKSQLQTIDSGIRLARSNEKGEREFLDDAQRASERKRAQDAIASDCK